MHLQASPGATTESFLVWSVDSMTDWGVKPTCFAISDQWGQCYLKLPLLVYSEFRLAGEGAETLPHLTC